MSDLDHAAIFALFFDGSLQSCRRVDTSRGDGDFRATLLVEADTGRYVIKLADNDFTSPERLRVWQRTAEEYRRLGYYCPRIYGAGDGGFPRVEYDGHTCTVHAEDFAPYAPASDRLQSEDRALSEEVWRGMWIMTARIAAERLDYPAPPSGYCLFETFCPGDETDEVLENALAWRECAAALPEPFQPQAQRIWRLWTENRAALEAVYGQLPTSVFQADLNPTNILLDDTGGFVGVYDFNLCGREVFLNYLMRENYGPFEAELEAILTVLEIARPYYVFSDIEKDCALMLYRCLKPLWYNRVQALKAAGSDGDAIRRLLDETERRLTAPIDFKSHMQ